MYLYRLYNKDKEVIYVGQTTNSVELRIKRHFSNYNNYKLDRLWKTEIQYYDYIELSTKAELDIYEIYYINKHKPIYNNQYKDDRVLTDRLNKLPDLPFEKIKDINNIIDLKYYKKKFKERKIELLAKQINSENSQNEYMIKAVDNLPPVINQMFNVIENQYGVNKRRDKLIAKLIVYYGLKINELVNLDLGDINIQEKTLKVGNKTFKLNEEIISDYEKYLVERNSIDNIKTVSMFSNNNKNKALFISRRKTRISTRVIQLMFNEFSEELNQDITPESLRKIFIKSLTDKTKDLNLLTSVTGLSENRVMNIYFKEVTN